MPLSLEDNSPITSGGSSESLRVLHVVHSLNAGGMENGIVNMAWHLADKGVNVNICCLTKKGAFADRLPRESNVTELGKPEGICLKSMLALRSLIKSTKPHLVHTHNWSGLLYGVGANYGRRIPLLHGEHAQLANWEKTRTRLLLRRLLFHQCQRVHTISEGQVVELLAQNVVHDQKKIFALPNGVDTERFSPGDSREARARLSLPVLGFYIGMVARFIRDKRHQLLLDAFEKVASILPGVRLLLAGDGGNCRNEVLQQITLHPYRDRIHWIGLRNDMPVVYRAMSLLVQPSETEGLSNAVLEGMSCGLPVISHQSCGASELVLDGGTGKVILIQNGETLAEGIIQMFSANEELIKMGAAGRKFVLERFGIDAMTERYRAIYRHMCHEFVQGSIVPTTLPS